MLFYNEDWMHFVWTRCFAGIEIDEKIIKDYIYGFKVTQITDFSMNVNGTISTADSKVFETYADKYLATEENGIPVDYKDTFAKVVYELIHEKKIDMYALWVDTLKEIGINPWLSIRMNDCHGNMFDTEFRKSSYVDKYPQYHIAAHRERLGYFDRCFDYSHKEVRQGMLDYIDEMLSRYDVYGLELDFMREIFTFQFGLESAGAPIMREFMLDISGVIEKYEKKYGHRIKRSLILPSDPKIAIEKGIDIFDFIDDIDMVVIIPRWETFDYDMPIEVWKRLLRGTNVKLACGHQLLFAPYRYYKLTLSSIKMAFGQAAANLSRGADLVYLYNYMDFAQHLSELKDAIYEESIQNDEKLPFIYSNIGKLETVLKQPRSHAVTYNDFGRYDIGVHPVLPVVFGYGLNEYKQIKVPVGKLPENAKLKLILGISQEDNIAPEDISVYVNATKCNFIEKTKIEPKIYDKECFAFDIGGRPCEIMYPEILILKKCRLEYVEIEVTP